MDEGKDRRVRALQELLASGVLTQVEYDEKIALLQQTEDAASGKDKPLATDVDESPQVLASEHDSDFDAPSDGEASPMSENSDAPAAVDPSRDSKKPSSSFPTWAAVAIAGTILVVMVIVALFLRGGGTTSSGSASLTAVTSTHTVTEANATFSVPDGFSKSYSSYTADGKTSAGRIYVSVDNPAVDADYLVEGWFDEPSSSKSDSGSSAAKHSYRNEGKAYSGVYCIHYAYDTAKTPEEFVVVFGDGDNNFYYIVLSGFEDSFYKEFVQSISISGSGGASSSSNSARSSSSSGRSSAGSSGSTGTSFVSTLGGLGAFEPQTIEGSGDDVIDVPCAGKPCLMAFSNSGSSNFIVHTLDASGDSVDGLINEIGPYEGTVTDYERYEKVTQLEIQSSGKWSVTFAPMKNMVRATNGAQFDGDDVVYIDEGGITKLSFTHDGDDNFIVHAIGLKKSDHLVNEIGSYSGTKSWNESKSFLIVNADGNWTVSW
ncbi:hypothetical protein AAY81_08600 [Denitrobacterium detoxificans]|uniref:Short C-terminal domain-containing protein n=1 Tax=Denitrobacterium detoxificans TaxID=79604 RepID=A0A172RZJ6_9ACTN|nr:hypothetical protein [Denitrobacterium detoxificans]ANE23157.1 hypothetical protein AAY81_08600 [Denitrobacterium detoxificans]SEO55123.1 hypothetical protein SAMN02910314_00535 [Denitrobacterium detoxificans]